MAPLAKKVTDPWYSL